MKVVFTTFFKESRGGGAGRVAYEIAQSFAKRHEVLLICPGLKTGLKKISPHLKYFQIRSAGQGDLAMPFLNNQNLKLIYDSLAKFAPDIVHAHDFSPLSLVTQFWTVNHQTPFIYTSHVLPTKTSHFIGEGYAFFGKLLDSKLFQRYFMIFFKSCDALIALNQVVKKNFTNLGFKQNVFVVPNGRDLKAYQKQKAIQISQKIKKLTFVGHICERKNQKYLLRVMRYLPKNYELNLVGSGLTPKNFQDLKQEAAKMKLNNVHLFGEIPYQKIPQVLGQTHVFVSASKMEVQSLVIIEALASGTPVVALSNETTDEFIDQSVGFWLRKKTQPEIFAQKVKEICSLSPSDYQKLCQNARKKVANLDWSKVVEQTTLIYQQTRILKQKQSQSQKASRLRRLKEILTLLPKSKFKAFLSKQIEKPFVVHKKGNNLFILALVVAFMGSFFLHLIDGFKTLKKR